jgi:hypothetical protein
MVAARSGKRNQDTGHEQAEHNHQPIPGIETEESSSSSE